MLDMAQKQPSAMYPSDSPFTGTAKTHLALYLPLLSWSAGDLERQIATSNKRYVGIVFSGARGWSWNCSKYKDSGSKKVISFFFFTRAEPNVRAGTRRTVIFCDTQSPKWSRMEQTHIKGLVASAIASGLLKATHVLASVHPRLIFPRLRWLTQRKKAKDRDTTTVNPAILVEGRTGIVRLPGKVRGWYLAVASHTQAVMLHLCHI
ncbi:hypothetical protein BGW80DRAFT_422583 [Lactifluus volemus]|nr:hypothetical protein BGW80DRAFT_422583 [Lactifluus volemus]